MNNKKIFVSLVVAVAILLGIVVGLLVKPSETIKVKEVINAEGEVVSGVLIGIVDDVAVMEKAKAYSMLRKEYESKMAALQEKGAKERDRLKALNDSIAAKRASLSQVDFDKEVEKFAKDQAETAARLNDEGRKIEKAYVDAVSRIRSEAVDAILQDLGKENGYSLIISKMVALIYDNSLDITAEVIKRLDAKMPKANLGI